jgi:hypothetical protein
MALATKISDFANKMVTLLEANAATLGIADGGVFYGDQLRVPVSPTVCVEPSSKTPTLYGAGRMTEVKIVLYLLVYHSDIRSISDNRRDADLLAEAICNLVNADGTFGGMCIHCYVNDVTSGFSTKTNTTMRATRITWEATTQERLPNNP